MPQCIPSAIIIEFLKGRKEGVKRQVKWESRVQGTAIGQSQGH
jgi:hypothetical protein